MAVLLSRAWRILSLCAVVALLLVVLLFQYPQEDATEAVATQQLRPLKDVPSSTPLPPAPCTCPKGSMNIRDLIPKEQIDELQQRREEELKKHKARTSSVLSSLLFAPSNSPLQYPIQGFRVRPLTRTLIPGLALNTGPRSSYKVSLSVSKGVLATESPGDWVKVKGSGEGLLSVECSSLAGLNDLLAKVSYTSTVYHINTGDLAHFLFEDHEVVFPIVIQQPRLPVLYNMGTDINSQVTVITKTFLRYHELNVMLSSIRRFYSNINIIIADDSLVPQKVTGEHIQQYIMPPAQGWFAGRNLAVSQVTTKYFLWVDDDFLFTEQTQIEKLVEVMEAEPDLDVVGGSVTGNQFFFSLLYEEGEDNDGGCLDRKSNGKFHPLRGFPQCSVVSGVVNFFLARTDSARAVGFDPLLQRVAHSEFFMDGLGSLMVATCSHVTIGHQRRGNNRQYSGFRNPGGADVKHKLKLHYSKNLLKCVHFG